MYCVIQKIRLKKPNTNGAYKELESYILFTRNGNPKYAYQRTGDKFERPIRTAYKISVHESKRVNGVVTKKQFVITTIGYYTFAEDWFALGDYDEKLTNISEKLNVDINMLYDIIDAKIVPLQECIQAEFRQTDEYKKTTEHDRIISQYKNAKAEFAEKYDCSDLEYDFCFDVFGELMNQPYYEKIIKNYEAKRSYRENFYNNHSKSKFDKDDFNLSGTSASRYNEAEKSMLKDFYRMLSKAYHPDITKSDGKEMQFINKLKESWGI